MADDVVESWDVAEGPRAGVLVELVHRPDQRLVELAESFLTLVRSGRITDAVIVALEPGHGCYVNAAHRSSLRLLGACEVAKDKLLRDLERGHEYVDGEE